MLKFILLIFIIPLNVFSQINFIGKSYSNVYKNGIFKSQIIITPLANENSKHIIPDQNITQPLNPLNKTVLKWATFDPAAIGDYCEVSGSGKYAAVSWNLNNQRVSLYRETDANPVWDFATNPLGYINFVSISDTGGVIASGSYQNMYLFNNYSGVPFFNFDLTTLADTGFASSIDVSKDGKFTVCCASRQDSSTVFGFNSQSGVPLWSKRLISSTVNGSSIYGVKMSGNDSLVIINTYYEYYVFRTYTGELIFTGTINGGTQTVQGISGDGSLIGIINYFGLLRVYKWNGSAYTLQFSNQEPPGTFYNWYTSVDISYDGNYVAAGTLNFISSTEVDGKVKVFKTSGGGVPLWTYSGCGDEVSNVSFSKNGNIISASSWGEFNNLKEDLYIWKTFSGNIPIFRVNSPGSFFWCSTSGDGRAVVASGKAVHARQFGNGGQLYFINVDTSDVPISVNNQNSIAVSDFRLDQNYPNPFNPVTVIRYSLNVNAFTELKIYNALGNEVKTLVSQIQKSGNYESEFDGSNLPSGIYFCKLQSNGFTDTKRMILLK